MQQTTFGHQMPPDCTVDMQHGECHQNYIRKIQASYSWDWGICSCQLSYMITDICIGPAFPGMGIWQNIYLQSTNECFFRSFSALPIRIDQSTLLYLYNTIVLIVQTTLPYNAN